MAITGQIDIDQFETDAKEDDDNVVDDVTDLIAAMKDTLGSAVADIRVSKALTDSPAVLLMKGAWIFKCNV